MSDRIEWIGPPKEPTPPAFPQSSDWTKRHPTRYHWTPTVRRRVVDPIFRKFDGISINTYVGHPEWGWNGTKWVNWSEVLGWNTATRSLDVWGIEGRGDPIGREKGDRVVRFVFNQPGYPWIAWCIWWKQIWTPDHGWQPWVSDGTGDHTDHPHFTFYPGR